ncbi:hypothetical protein K3495_g3690 [Podosphaera aphanis]|nr:hypothetical protein K3495_g3690 [Podosphaera aphanis]
MSSFMRRQYLSPGDDIIIVQREPSFWWTKTGQIIRWSVFFGIITILTLYTLIGYYHAKRRMKKGLPLLAYHRWLVSDELREIHDPTYVNPRSYYIYSTGPTGYGMQAMPPPLYDPNAPLPPSYRPPNGATKVDPSQWHSEPTIRPQTTNVSPNYEAPPGPPPAAIRPDQTGAPNNPFKP